jgi:NDP-4-keto-2,6-dideoxyhexose 3-C-methyltransferase
MQDLVKCRGCYGREFKDIIDLGPQWTINFGDKPATQLPIKLVMCSQCKLVQSAYVYDPDQFFKHYYYKSGVNQTMSNHLKELNHRLMKLVDPCTDEVVIDIGSNDTTFLNFYPPTLSKIGFEPAKNLDIVSTDCTIVNDYFTDNIFTAKARIITAIGMFYDLQEPNKFLNDIKNTLASDGVFCIEMNYLVSMIENMAIDNATAEHCCFYTVHTLEPLLRKVELEIFRIEQSNINGGTIRLYIKNMGYDRYPIGPEVDLYRRYVDRGYDEPLKYILFKDRLDRARDELYSFVKAHGPVWAYGASTRGYTLLQTMGLTNKDIVAIADRNPSKHGTMLSGLDIPVKTEEEWRGENPPYTLVLPWYFEKEFVEREKNYLAGGGRFIIALPTFKIVGAPI